MHFMTVVSMLFSMVYHGNGIGLQMDAIRLYGGRLQNLIPLLILIPQLVYECCLWYCNCYSNKQSKTIRVESLPLFLFSSLVYLTKVNTPCCQVRKPEELPYFNVFVSRLWPRRNSVIIRVILSGALIGRETNTACALKILHTNNYFAVNDGLP